VDVNSDTETEDEVDDTPCEGRLLPVCSKSNLCELCESLQEHLQSLSKIRPVVRLIEEEDYIPKVCIVTTTPTFFQRPVSISCSGYNILEAYLFYKYEICCLQLLEIFSLAESCENMESLHHLYNIFKCLVLLNDTSLLNIMFTEDNLMAVVGVLEYDSNILTRSNHHRDFLTQATYHQVIPFSHPFLVSLNLL